MSKKQIYREGVWYYVGVPGQIRRIKTGANRKGFLNAIKLMRVK